MHNLLQKIFLCWCCLTAIAMAAPSMDARFFKLTDNYFDTFLFPTNPTLATQLGVHTYDNMLADYSKTGLAREITTLQAFEKRVHAVSPTMLGPQARADRELVLNDIRSQLLTLQKIRPWEKNPDFYSSDITASAFVIMKRQFAPASTRLRLLIAREKLMPAVLQEAQHNLKNPPRVFTKIALEQLPGLINFFAKDVPAAFTTVNDKTLQKQFAESNTAVIKALMDYQHWLRNYLLPHSHGNFRIGAANFSKKLQYDEMVDTPLEQLLAIGYADLRHNQAAYQRLAKEIDPNKSMEAVSAETAKDHPTPDQLLTSFKATFDSLIKFIRDKKIITIPSDIRPIMEETPPFLRATTFASMDTPGPFESSAKEAFFNVTLPDPQWNQEKVNEYMGSFTYPTIISTAVHETYPGHYVQFLWMHEVHDRVRKILGANTNAEGWAHYCEQMMLDEGYGTPGYGAKNEREAKLLRLGQLTDALLRDARFIVGIQMHTGKMSLQQAIKFFVKEGYQSPSTGLIEAKRGTSDPTYLYYTLGKLQILQLRAELQAKEGPNFSLKKFHDDFMRQGYPPIKIVRRALLATS
jgi:uncharacterized protein (DUF885 family)